MCYTPRTQNKLVLRTIGILIEEDSVHGYLSFLDAHKKLREL